MTATLGAGGRAALTVLITLIAAQACAGPDNHSKTAEPRPPTTTGRGWTTYHHDNARTGLDPSAPSFAAASKPLASWNRTLGAGENVFAEPLVYKGVVFAATENDSVYALDERTGKVLWSTHVESAATDVQCLGNPPGGITSTPVIDPSSGVLYAVGEHGPGTSPQFDLYALNISNGSRAAPIRNITPPGMPAHNQGQRGALALANGTVYVPFGGRAGDCLPFHTYFEGVPEKGGPIRLYAPQASNQFGASVWAPSGEAIDAAGDVYFETGNGFSKCGQAWDHGSGVIKLSPTLSEVSTWAPADWCSLNQSDTDLGSVGPTLLSGSVAFASGKSGDGWLLDTARLGGVGAPPLYSAHVDDCPHTDAVYGGFAYSAPILYVPCVSAGLVALDVSTSPPYRFSTRWAACDCFAGSPIVAGGLVFFTAMGGGTLYGADAITGAIKVRQPIDDTSRFATPAEDSGWVLVPTNRGVQAFRFAGSAS